MGNLKQGWFTEIYSDKGWKFWTTYAFTQNPHVRLALLYYMA
jgi:hypothetical protein